MFPPEKKFERFAKYYVKADYTRFDPVTYGPMSLRLGVDADCVIVDDDETAGGPNRYVERNDLVHFGVTTRPALRSIGAFLIQKYCD